MLITALNKLSSLRSWLLILMICTPSLGHAHGHGGLEGEEMAVLFESMMQAIDEATDRTARELTELEVRYGGRPSTDPMVIEYLGRRMKLHRPAFAKVVDRGLNIWRARVERASPELYFEPRLRVHLSFREKMIDIFEKVIVHQVLLMRDAFLDPNMIITGGVHLAGWSTRKLYEEGKRFVGYTVVTEAIESAFFGAWHVACPLFQILYVPASFVMRHVEDPIRNRGHGYPMVQRLGGSIRAFKLVLDYKRDMRHLLVVGLDGRYRGVTSEKGYREFLAGADHHMEAELNMRRFWPESMRNFHAPETTPLVRHPSELDLRSDYDIIFGANHPEGAELGVESDRFYVALKHGDGLLELYDMLQEMLSHQVEVKRGRNVWRELYLRARGLPLPDVSEYKRKYTIANQIRIESILGHLGAYIKNYRTLVLVGAVSPRENPALQAHQRALADAQLDHIKTALKDAYLLLQPKRFDQETIKWLAGEIGGKLKPAAAEFKKKLLTKVNVAELEIKDCAALLARSR